MLRHRMASDLRSTLTAPHPSWQSRSLRVSALHCCAIGGHPGVAEILIEAGADTNLRDGVREVTLLQLLVHSCMLC